jgi:6-phosphogluconolactonase (cycloisomerase 2 family)
MVRRTVSALACALAVLVGGCTNPFFEHVKMLVDRPVGPRLTLSAGGMAIGAGGNFDFGKAAVGSTQSVVLTIKNTGDSDLVLSGTSGLVAVGGADATDFPISVQPPASTIHAGSMENFTLLFTPSAYGARTAVLSIASNDAVGSGTRTATGLGAVATPAFSPAPGTYSANQNVLITCSPTPDAIYYTTNGTTPTTASFVYSASIPVNGNGTTVTIKAFAVKAGAPDSLVATGTFSINTGVVSTPNFSPPGTTYSADQNVSITSDAGATIYYTTNGSDPNPTSPIYAGPILVTGGTTTVKAYAVKSGFADSAIAAAVYTINYPPAAAPTFLPGGGSFQVLGASLSVQIDSPSPGTSVRYTTNGTIPTPSTGTLLSTFPQSISLATSSTLQAIAFGPAWNPSAVTSQSYFLQSPDPTLAPVPPFTSPGAFDVTITSPNPAAQIRYTTNGTTPSAANGLLVASPATVHLIADATINARTEVTGWTPSGIVSGAYQVLVCATPTLTPTGGTIGTATQVQIATTTAGASIAYTTDGSTPTESAGFVQVGTLYGGPFTLPYGATTVTAIAFKTGYADSAPAAEIYDVPEFLYVKSSSASTVEAFRVNVATGALTPVGGAATLGTTGGIAAATSPAGSFLFASSPASGVVRTYSINPGSGGLSFVGDYPSGTPSPDKLITRPSGGVLYSSDDLAGPLVTMHIDPGIGGLSVAGSAGGSLDPAAMAVDPTNSYLYLADGSGTDIRFYALDAAGLAVESVLSPFVATAPMAGAAISGVGPYLYASESGGTVLYGYRINPADGTLSTISGSPFGLVGGFGGAVAMHPTGNALVAVDQTSNSFELFGVNGVTGSLLNHGLYGAGTTPVSAAFDPSGRYLFVVNSFSNNISVFSVDLAVMSVTPVPGSPFPAVIPGPAEITIISPAN